MRYYISIIFLLFLSIASCTPEEQYLNQTAYNIKIYEEYELLNKKLDSVYQNTLTPYLDCRWCWEDSLSIERNNFIKTALIQSQKKFNEQLAEQDEIISTIYERGTMRSGVLNKNRTEQIKARIAFYELLN